MGNGANFPYIITGGYPGQNDNLADLFVDGTGPTTNYKGYNGGDIGDYSMASMHSSDTRDGSGVPYFVNGTNITNLFRSIEFNPVNVVIPNAYGYNNGYSGPYSQIITPNLFGTNYNSSNYSILWTYEGNDGNPIVYATADSPLGNSTAFTLHDYNSSDSDITTTVKCTITDNHTGESARDYAYITWYNL